MEYNTKEKLINFRNDLIKINEFVEDDLKKDKDFNMVKMSNKVSVEDIERNERIIQVIEQQLKKEFDYDILDE